MSLFEFLMVLVSLIIGLGVAELLSGVAQTIRNGSEVKLYWAHSTFVLIIFLALLQQWWEIWELRDTPVWTFPGLLMMLGGPIGLFLVSHLVFPERMAGSNLRSYYYEKLNPALWVGVLTAVLSVTFRPVIFGAGLFEIGNITAFLLIAIFIGMVYIKHPTFHGVMVLLVLTGVLADILYIE